MTRRLHVPVVALFALAPALALAEVGEIEVLQGSGTRTPEGGKAEALKVGMKIDLKDVLVVDKGGNAKLVLADESVLMVAGGSQLVINEAEFQGLERKGFSAKLLFGKVWAKVKKAAAGSDAKFEVTTDRAVAGVRGTVFRVDTKMFKAAVSGRPVQKSEKTIVRVWLGKVAVEATVKKIPDAQPAGGTSGKVRTLVQGPQEISKDEWEKKFVELQKNMQVVIGDASFDTGELKLDKGDAFAKFVDANAPAAQE